MARTIVKTLIAAVAICGAMVPAVAIPIDITVNATGNLLHTIGIADSTQYLPGNNDPSSNLSFLNTEIGNWNGAGKIPALSSATLTDFLNEPNSSDFITTGNTFKLASGAGKYDYVVFHFGAGAAGGHQVSPGGWWEAEYLGGTDFSLLTFSVPSVNGKSVGGISSARFFDSDQPPTSVPDTGSSILLLGMGLLAIGGLAHKLRHA